MTVVLCAAGSDVVVIRRRPKKHQCGWVAVARREFERLWTLREHQADDDLFKNHVILAITAEARYKAVPGFHLFRHLSVISLQEWAFGAKPLEQPRKLERCLLSPAIVKSARHPSTTSPQPLGRCNSLTTRVHLLSVAVALDRRRHVGQIRKGDGQDDDSRGYRRGNQRQGRLAA